MTEQEITTQCSKCGQTHAVGEECMVVAGAEAIISLTPEQQAGQQRLVGHLTYGRLDKVKQVIDLCQLPREAVQQAGQQGLVDYLKHGQLDKVKQVIDFCQLPKEIIQQAGQQGLVDYLKSNWLDKAKQVIDLCQLPREAIQSPEVQQAGQQGLVYYLKNDRLDKAKQVIDLCQLPREAVQQAGQQGLVYCFKNDQFNRAKQVIDLCQLPREAVQQAGQRGLVDYLKYGQLDKVKQVIDLCQLPREAIQSSEVQQDGQRGLVFCLKNDRLDKAKQVIDLCQLPKEIIQSPEVQQAGQQGLVFCLKNDRLDKAKQVIDFCQLPREAIQSSEVQQAGQQRLVDHLTYGQLDKAKQVIDFCQLDFGVDSFTQQMEVSSWEELFKFFEEMGIDYYSWVLKKNNGVCNLKRDDLLKANKIGLTYPEADVSVANGVDLAAVDEESWQKRFSFFKNNEKLQKWQDEQNINGPFARGAEIFGFQRMFAYINRAGLSLHDALHNFDEIIALQQASGLPASQFYFNILQQANMDGAGYETGTAQHELNSIANNINLDFENVFSQIKKYKQIKKMQELAAGLSSPQDIFASWKNLKKYADLCDLLGRTEILEQLAELQGQPGKEKLYRYIETLAFHPNINMQAVFKFWRDPDSFLDVGDSHSAGVHEYKKPTNYTDIPNLDLSAEDLRDALVEGKLDALQAFEPLEIEYELPAGETIVPAETEAEKDARALVKEALGSRREKIAGKAKAPSKLFAELARWFKKQGLNFKDYLAGEAELAPNLNTELLAIVNDNEFGLGQAKSLPQKTVKYRLKINLKSDPDGVVAGNDTACCMPFGSGKNNVYTFNPVCSLLIIQQARAEGAWRTVAQSVLTKDKDIKKNLAEVQAQFHSADKPSIKDVLPVEILQVEKFILACDNVELNPNVKGHRLTEEQIEMLYRDFMYEYLQRYAARDNLDGSQVVIGKGFSDSLTHLPEIPNTFAPAAPVAYSDKSHATVYQLAPKEAIGVKKQIVDRRKPSLQRELYSTQNGVSLLTFEDAIPVAYIEGKAYESNPTLVQYLHNMENGLIAKDINNVDKDRPDMSMKYTGDDGKIHGYLLAYEGVWRENDDDYLEETETAATPIIYVSDIASDLTVKGAGHALMLAFLEQYKHCYADRGNFIPIYAQAREQTSYAIIKKNLERYGQQVGLDLEMEELGTEQAGDDVMHRIVIKVNKS